MEWWKIGDDRQTKIDEELWEQLYRAAAPALSKQGAFELKTHRNAQNRVFPKYVKSCSSWRSSNGNSTRPKQKIQTRKNSEDILASNEHSHRYIKTLKDSYLWTQTHSFMAESTIHGAKVHTSKPQSHYTSAAGKQGKKGWTHWCEMWERNVLNSMCQTLCIYGSLQNILANRTGPLSCDACYIKCP